MQKRVALKLFLLTTIFTLSGYCGIYDYSYSPVPVEQEGNTTSEPNLFMYGDFDEIIHFKALLFNDDGLTEQSQQYLDTIIKTVDEYNDDKTIGVTIIAYTESTTDDRNEAAIASKSYASKIQNWFSKDLDTNSSEKISAKFAKKVQQLLIDKGMDEKKTTLEIRGANDNAYSDATSEGRALSNRVMVSLYVFTPEEPEIDSDGDGVIDKIDVCPGTPKGIVVDSKGCPLDSDGDGVYDYMDLCPGTPKSFKVDVNGCPLVGTLRLNFAFNKYKIEEHDSPKVASFAQFLRENSQYKVELSGHTDSVGDESYNLTLSFLRANEVRKALIQEGIDSKRLIVTGLGESMPIFDNEAPEGRYANRRVEMKLYY